MGCFHDENMCRAQRRIFRFYACLRDNFSIIDCFIFPTIKFSMSHAHIQENNRLSRKRMKKRVRTQAFICTTDHVDGCALSWRPAAFPVHARKLCSPITRKYGLSRSTPCAYTINTCTTTCYLAAIVSTCEMQLMYPATIGKQ